MINATSTKGVGAIMKPVTDRSRVSQRIIR